MFVAQEDVFAGAKVIPLPKGLWRAVYLSIDGTATANGLMSGVGSVRLDRRNMPMTYVNFAYLYDLTDRFGGSPLKTEGATTAFAVELPLVYPPSKGSCLIPEDGDIKLFFPKVVGSDHLTANLEVHMIPGEEEQTHLLHLFDITRTLGGQRALDPGFQNILGVLIQAAATTDPTRLHATKDGFLVENTDWPEFIRKSGISGKLESAVTVGYQNFMGRSKEPSAMVSGKCDIVFTGGAGDITSTVIYSTFEKEALAMSQAIRTAHISDALRNINASQGDQVASEVAEVVGQSGDQDLERMIAQAADRLSETGSSRRRRRRRSSGRRPARLPF